MLFVVESLEGVQLILVAKVKSDGRFLFVFLVRGKKKDKYVYITLAKHKDIDAHLCKAIMGKG